MKKTLLVLVLAGLAVAAPASAGTAPTLRGVVISRLPAQGELVIASPNGTTTTVRSPSLPAMGTRVKTSTFALSDGTSAARKLTVVGRVHRVRFSGVLVRTSATTSFFAVGRSVIAVHTPARSLASATSTGLVPGEGAEIEVTITPAGALNEDSATPTHSHDADELNLQITIAAVAPATATTPGSLTLTIDGQTLVIPLAPGTVLPATFVANATVGVEIEFRQPGEDNDNNDNNPPTTVMTTTTVTTTTTSSSGPGNGSSGRGDRNGDGDGGHGNGGGPGPSGGGGRG
jgi:uncharacterized membrane protein YgcG